MVTKLTKLIKFFSFIPVIGDGLYSLNPIHIDDLSNFIVKLLMDNSNLSYNKVYTLCGPEPESFIVFCKNIARYYNKNIYFIKLPLNTSSLVLMILNKIGYKYIAHDQIDRLVMKKSNDFSSALKDYNFKPRFFLNNSRFQ